MTRAQAHLAAQSLICTAIIIAGITNVMALVRVLYRVMP
jgi:hypothetical protein